jgi:transposase
MSQVASWNHLESSTLEKQYKHYLSDYRDWRARNDVDALVYPENFGKRMSIDETVLAEGELYTILTNKDARGKRGALAAVIKGTRNAVVSKALDRVPLSIRVGVKEITADLDSSMGWICHDNFICAVLVADRFHVQGLVHEAVQEMRILKRRKAIDDENELQARARERGQRYYPKRHENGDTQKQLLARSRYLLFKPKERWTASQWERSRVLFHEYPDLQSAYDLSMEFRCIYENKRYSAEQGKRRIQKWIAKAKDSQTAQLVSCSQTILIHLGEISNYFDNRATNAGAESFNAKIKAFRSQLRGVNDTAFFLYRLQKYFA